MKRMVLKIVAATAFAASFVFSPSVFASDRFPLPHELLGIPTPHELLGIPAPHELLLGPDRYSRYNYSDRGYRDNRYYYRDDRRYSRPYRGYDRYRYDRRNYYREDRHHHRDDHGRRGHHH